MLEEAKKKDVVDTVRDTPDGAPPLNNKRTQFSLATGVQVSMAAVGGSAAESELLAAPGPSPTVTSPLAGVASCFGGCA